MGWQLRIKNKLTLFSFPGLCLILLLIIAWLVFNRHNIQEFFSSYQLRNKVLTEAQMLEKEIDTLEQQKTELIKGDFETERLLREKFKMVLPGEHLMVVKREAKE